MKRFEMLPLSKPPSLTGAMRSAGRIRHTPFLTPQAEGHRGDPQPPDAAGLSVHSRERGELGINTMKLRDWAFLSMPRVLKTYATRSCMSLRSTV